MENQRDLYDQLIKPSWAPPPWLFSYVWAIIYVSYTLVALFAYDDWDANHIVIYALYFTGWGINILWLILFRKSKPSVASTITIGVHLAVLIGMAGLLLSSEGSENFISFCLLWPYILWLLFALVLSIRLLQLNR